MEVIFWVWVLGGGMVLFQEYDSFVFVLPPPGGALSYPGPLFVTPPPPPAGGNREFFIARALTVYMWTFREPFRRGGW